MRHSRKFFYLFDARFPLVSHLDQRRRASTLVYARVASQVSFGNSNNTIILSRHADIRPLQVNYRMGRRMAARMQSTLFGNSGREYKRVQVLHSHPKKSELDIYLAT
jgi:hypothetical protein